MLFRKRLQRAVFSRRTFFFILLVFAFGLVYLLTPDTYRTWQPPRKESPKRSDTSPVKVVATLHNGLRDTMIRKSTSWLPTKPRKLSITDNSLSSPAKLVVCEDLPSTLLGKLSFDILDLYSAELRLGSIKVGGSWRPENCTAREKVAVLVPYRLRPKQLKVFLNHMHPVLQRQKIDYQIFVAEQVGSEKFNKGAIYNIAYLQSSKYGDYDCYIFHDIDLLTLNDHNIYTCSHSPMQMSAAVDSPTYITGIAPFGGIQAIKKKHYIQINGHSNEFWGWGGEDENLAQRVKLKKLVISRPSKEIGRYKKNMKNHYRLGGVSMENVQKVRKGVKTVDDDGITTVSSLEYTVEKNFYPLYTLFSIDLHRK